MYWKDTSAQESTVPPDVVDLVFDISCRALPSDHAYDLWQTLQASLPWFVEEPEAGIHPIYGAESGNGWMRPDGPQALLYLSRRTKLVLRLPSRRTGDAGALSGRMLAIGAHRISIGAHTARPLNPLGTIFARHVATRSGDDEDVFLRQCMDELEGIGVAPRKMLCGREARIATPDGGVRTRSLMLAELTPAESIQLQLRGLGPWRQLGCGLFIGHKDIKPVKRDME
ncbi:MAG: type I-MYXAN CRISPR-associated protein Cas6/Cmx6 [Acidiferrobacteraceae bacterium]